MLGLVVGTTTFSAAEVDIRAIPLSVVFASR